MKEYNQYSIRKDKLDNAQIEGSICSCCGAQLCDPKGTKRVMERNEKGIKIITKDVGIEERVGRKITIKRIDTKNGPITVSIRTVW